MYCLALKIMTLITAKAVVICNNDLTEASRVFSVASYGKLPGELLLAASKDIVEDCLYECMQHLACLKISYHSRSNRCELLANLLYKDNLIQNNKWVSYGHFERELVRYVYGYVLSFDEYFLA